VRTYVEHEGTLDSLRVFASGNTPVCWHWIFGFELGPRKPYGYWLADVLQPSWFDEKLGWNLNAVQEYGGFGPNQEIAVLKGLESVNGYRRDNKKKLDQLTADIEKLGSLAPYNSLFDLMEMYDMEYDHFLHVERPAVADLFSVQGGDIGAGFLAHLRPGRMLSFRDEDGEIVKPSFMDKTSFKACSRCNKVKDDVRDEFCALMRCVSANSVCPDCTTERSCSTCSRTNCKCHFAECCHFECQNYMCHGVLDCQRDDYYYDAEDNEDEDDGRGPGCSFVRYPPGLDFDDRFEVLEAEEHKWCKVHKPARAVKLQHWYI
jgi:hypothetical protein